MSFERSPSSVPTTSNLVAATEPWNIRRLQRAILVYSALTLLLLSSAVAALSLLPLYRSSRERREQSLLDVLHSRALTVDEYRDRAEQIAMQIASRTTARQQLEAYNRGEFDLATLQGKSKVLLWDALQQGLDVVGITRLDAMEQPVIEIGTAIPADTWPVPPRQSREVTVRPLVEHIANRAYIVVGTPIIGADGDRVGTDIVLFEAEKLQQIVADFEGWGATGQVFLATVWQDSPQILLPIEENKQTDPKLTTAIALAGYGGIGLLLDEERTTTIAYSPVAESQWVLIATVDAEELYAPVRQQLLNIGGTTIILILLSVGGMLLLLRPLTGRIALRAEELAEIVRSQNAALLQAHNALEQRVEERTTQLSQEVRDRKRAEADLQAVTERLSLALKSGDLGYWQWVIATNDVFWDDRLYELHGIPKGSLTFSLFRASVHPDDILLLEELVQHAIADKHHENELGCSVPYELIYRAVCPDGKTNYIKSYGSVLRDRDGAATGMLGVSFNVTQIKLAEEQLAFSNQELKRASQMKDEFLATMSHELRTPLNAVLGMTESLQEEVFGTINPPQLDALNLIEQSGRHLLNLINDILDLSKISAGKIELFLTPTEVDQLCYASLPLIQKQAQAKRLQIQTKIPASLPIIMMDPQRIRQVLINLLNNAIKFTPEDGQITLSVHPHPVPDPTGACAQGFLRLTVSDTGIGIAAENLEKLFQPFVQIDSALNRRYEGTGLGLALVKQIVELHGGKVTVTSEVNLGSSFIVDLPWVAPTPPQPQISTPIEDEIESQTRDGPMILLVEDDNANIVTFSLYLEAKGYRLTLARNGQEAIELVQSIQPKLILMDIQMPVMDGLEATTYIRQTLGLVDIPIIALTGLAMRGDQERCLEAGVTDYVSKPVELKQLDALLQKYLS